MPSSTVSVRQPQSRTHLSTFCLRNGYPATWGSSVGPRPRSPTIANHRFASNLTSSDKRSHYEILGLGVRATASEIKQRYYELSKKYHPDRNRAAPADERRSVAKKYNRIKEAYEVLRHTDSRAAFDAELLNRDGTMAPGFQTQRNARGNEHYYGHAKYAGSTHQASSLHRRPSRQHAYYTSKHQGYEGTHRSQTQTGEDPLRPRHTTGHNDVPHFDFDKHFHQQQSYDNHRKQQNIKNAQRKFAEERAPPSAFQTDQDFIHEHYSPQGRPPKHVLTLTGPRLIMMGCGGMWVMYMIVKHLF